MKTIASKAADLAVVVPQVVALRLTQMALAGPRPNRRDRNEFALMFAEKNSAFRDAWLAMGMQSLLASQAISTAWLRSAWAPGGWGGPTSGKLIAQTQRAALDIFGAALAPVHRTAVANGKRLAKSRRR